MILGVVKGQELSLSAPVMASETIAYLTAEFQFSPDWEGLTKYAFFEKRGQKPHKIELVDDKITEDKQLNLEEGIYEVYLIGMELADGKTYQRITTVVSAIEVEKTGFLDGEPFPVEPPSFGEQLLQRITVLETKAIPKGGKKDYVLTKSSDNDFDTEWKPQTGGGGGSGTFDHNELINRDMANQHPISAIDGLTEALAGKQTTGDYATRIEVAQGLETKVDKVEGSRLITTPEAEKLGRLLEIKPTEKTPEMNSPVGMDKTGLLFTKMVEKTSELTNDSGFTTETFVQNAIDKAIGNLSTVIDSINGTIGGDVV